MDENFPSGSSSNNNNNNRDNNNRNFGPNRPRGGNRFRHGGGGGGGSRPGHFQNSGRGRAQRPLLTSAINGAGFSLMSVLILGPDRNTTVHNLLSIAVIVFGLSALVSYVAQRLRPAVFEKVSDVFFIVGAGLLIVVGVMIGGFISF